MNNIVKKKMKIIFLFLLVVSRKCDFFCNFVF